MARLRWPWLIAIIAMAAHAVYALAPDLSALNQALGILRYSSIFLMIHSTALTFSAEDPGAFVARKERAALHLERGEDAAALADLRVLAELSCAENTAVERANALEQAARLSAGFGDLAGAEALLRDALAHDGKHEHALQLRAKTKQGLRLREEIAAQWAACRAATEDKSRWTLLGVKITELFALSLAARDPLMREYMANVALHTGTFEAAMAEFQCVLFGDCVNAPSIN